jgi:lipopolysaccharide heptosyltransferase II
MLSIIDIGRVVDGVCLLQGLLLPSESRFRTFEERILPLSQGTDSSSRFAARNMERILVIKLYAIGDLIMSLPSLELLRKQHPSAEIHLLTGRIVAPLAECSAPVDRIISVDERILTDRRRLFSLLSLAIQLRKKKYTHAYLLHRVLPLRLFLFATGIRERTGQGEKRMGLTRIVPFETGQPEHDAERYARIFGWSRQEELPRAVISVPEEKLLRAVKMTKGEGFVTINAGGGRSSVRTLDNIRWPHDRFLKVIKKLDRSGIRTVVVGSAGDRPGLESFQEALPSSSVDLIGKTSVIDVAAVISMSRLLITNDSGLMHIAAAVDTPTVTIFGPSDPIRTGVFPTSTMHRVVKPKNVACHPCQPGHAGLTCTRSVCMQAVTVTMVQKEVEEILEI